MSIALPKKVCAADMILGGCRCTQRLAQACAHLTAVRSGWACPAPPFLVSKMHVAPQACAGFADMPLRGALDLHGHTDMLDM